MARKPGLAELIQDVRDKKAPNAMKKRLKELGETNPMLLEVLKFTYHPGIIRHPDIPEGAPPYEEADKTFDLQGQLYAEWRRLPIFYVNPKYDKMHITKRQKLFIELLESLDPDDAKLVIEIKDKKLKGISEKMVRECFPDLLPPPPKKEKSE